MNSTRQPAEAPAPCDWPGDWPGDRRPGRRHAIARAAPLVALALAAGLATVARAAPAGPVPALGQDISLPVGASTALAGGWRLGFDGVGSDSRCPRGAQCISAGDATVRLWLQPPSQPREALLLHTTAPQPREAAVQDLVVTLQHLQPQPQQGRAIPPRAYVATVVVQRRPGPERPGR